MEKDFVCHSIKYIKIFRKHSTIHLTCLFYYTEDKKIILYFWKIIIDTTILTYIQYNLTIKIMSKSKDSRKNLKKEPAKTPKEKRAEKRLKKAQKS